MKQNININKTFNKNEIKKLINWFINNYGSIRTTKLLDKLKNIGFQHCTKAGISLGIEDLSIPKNKDLLFENSEKEISKNQKNYEQGKINEITKLEKVIKLWNNTNEMLKEEIIINFRESNLINPLFMMTLSGARGNISQVKQLVGMRGLMSDSKGEIISLPIKNNFKEGLTITEYFISCYGARKGLVDTALKTANSGYLTRRLIYVAQNQIIKQPNCCTKYKNLILNLKRNKEEYKFTKKNLLGRVLATNIKRTSSGKTIISLGQDICNFILNKIINVKKIYIRSPLTCQLNTGICQMCYGWNLGNGRMVELGESVGIISAQSIGEPGTQLTMRTFHTGGIFSGEITKTIISPHKGKVIYKLIKTDKKIKNKYNEKVILTSKKKNLKIIENNINISLIKLPKNSLIFLKPNEKIHSKQIIAEILEKKIARLKKKEKKEIKSSISGKLYFDNTKKKVLCIVNSNIISYKCLYIKMNNNLNFSKKKYIAYKNLNKNIIKTKKHKSKEFKLKINFKNILKIKRNTKKILKEKYNYIIKIVNNQDKQLLTKKIKTEKYLEIENKKIAEFLYNEKKLNKHKKNIYSCIITQKRKNLIKTKKIKTHLINQNFKINKKNTIIKKNNLLFYSLYEKLKTKDIVQGLPKIEQLLESKKSINLEKIINNPHDKLKKLFKKFSKDYSNQLATRKSIEKIQTYLIKKIQSVYESQGVEIANKHIEIIIKQMTNKIIINEEGDSKFITGETIELSKIEQLNNKLSKKIKYEPILIGISKTSLTSQSFISAASFQETTKVLTKAAIEGKIDWLYGIKENIVLGNIIPVGTGFKEN
uniref:RNA polymerase subunit beta' n=1 Tax=Euglena deses TaxID=66845 RepID=UPI0023AB4AA3|nr:RNA polymerase subunit beta' [Euglena deses]WCH63399.1 RNA polymerase subunit beta' [Euglena deses]